MLSEDERKQLMATIEETAKAIKPPDMEKKSK
jgi:hypothetical protein